ncbi:cytochrome C [Bradyrhizobium sp. Arg62]|nr:di-heme-cytochrome C peroxidase [Bradyrhizobium brasilense]MCC8948170.1 cytochrome C [Bradyrhizobium brasilense]
MQNRGDGVLRWEDQPDIFDVTLPLKTRAEEFMARSSTDENVVRRLFTLRLAQVATIGDPVRRRARKSECTPEEWSVAERLAGPNERLLTISASASGYPIAEVAHEQLLQRWPRLEKWLEAERGFLIWRTEVEQELEKYRSQAGERRSDALLMGLRLTAAEEWMRARADDLDPELRTFVLVSIVHRNTEEQDKRDKEIRLKELQIEAERKRAEEALEKEKKARQRLRSARSLTRFLLAVFALLMSFSVAPIVGVALFPDTMRELLPANLAAIIAPPMPDRPPAKRIVWLDQNWSEEDRNWFHHVSVGTTIPIPYAWFVALERPQISLFGSPGFLSDSEYLERLGFISSSKSVRQAQGTSLGGGRSSDSMDTGASRSSILREAENPDGLPVGFARTTGAFDPATRAQLQDQIGVTCAACHTGHLEYKGTSLRFDGGPGMIDVKKFELTVGLSIAYTASIPGRFGRFASRVLGEHAKDEDRAALKARLAEVSPGLVEESQQITRYMVQQGGIEMRGQAEGFGRLDWLSRIGNQIFYSDLTAGGIKGFEKNFRQARAPVSFPPLWTVPWFARGGSVTSSSTLLYSMTTEALGAAALTDLVGVTELGAQYRSSVPVRTLDQIEALLRGPAFNKGLTAPRWPASLFANDAKWQIDLARAQKGRALYREMCAECHLGPLNDPEYDLQYPDRRLADSSRFRTEDRTGDRFLVPVINNIKNIGTDPEQAQIVASRNVAVPAFLDIDPVRDLGQKRNCPDVKESKSSELPYSVAVMVIVDRVVSKALSDLALSDKQRAAILGMRKDCPSSAPEPSYVARPLNGVWATAPYLHNGSVPSLYDLLIPAAERPKSFCVGAREFDPLKVGLDQSSPCSRGESVFSTTGPDGAPGPGNSTSAIHSRDRAAATRLASLDANCEKTNDLISSNTSRRYDRD